MTNKLTMNYLTKLSLKWAPNDILDICIDMKIRNDSIGMSGEWPVAVFALGKKVLLQSRRQELGLAGLDSIMMMIQIQIQKYRKRQIHKYKRCCKSDDNHSEYHDAYASWLPTGEMDKVLHQHKCAKHKYKEANTNTNTNTSKYKYKGTAPTQVRLTQTQI